MSDPAYWGVLLAAGEGRRFGAPKLLERLDGVAMGVAACRALVAALPSVIAVVRPGDAELAASLEAEGARIVVCAHAAEGMGASLACGVRATADAAGWIVALADMPWIRPATIGAVAATLANGAIVAAPRYEGRRGHPVGFGRGCCAALAALRGDAGARSIVAAHHRTLVGIDVDDPGILRDVDTRADLERR